MKEVKVVTPTVNKYAEAVLEFNTAFSCEPGIYLKLIMEEFNEWFWEAEQSVSIEQELKELCDLLYVCYGYAAVEQMGDIPKSKNEVNEIIDSVTKNKSKYPNTNLPVTVIATAYIEFITSKDFLWLYRLVQGIFAYAKIKGFPMEQAFKRVHDSNMSKLGTDGKPVLREDGKVLKGPNYKPAKLGDLLDGPKMDNKKSRAKGARS